MQNHFTIIIDSCNHEQWINRCLDTCLSQKYDNYEVILVDARSDDKTFEVAQEYAKDFKNLKVYQNEKRLPQVANFLELTKLSKDGTICVSVDGDDFLKHGRVLQKLDEVYSSGSIFMTYGSYVEFCGDDKPLRDVSWHYHAYPDDVIKNNSFREYKWLASHIRTFRRELLLKIIKESLIQKNGEWMSTSGDQAIMLPMLELSGEHSRFVPDILYVYNTSNENKSRDTASNEAKQLEVAKYIRSLPKYQPLKSLD